MFQVPAAVSRSLQSNPTTACLFPIMSHAYMSLCGVLLCSLGVRGNACFFGASFSTICFKLLETVQFSWTQVYLIKTFMGLIRHVTLLTTHNTSSKDRNFSLAADDQYLAVNTSYWVRKMPLRNSLKYLLFPPAKYTKYNWFKVLQNLLTQKIKYA